MNIGFEFFGNLNLLKIIGASDAADDGSINNFVLSNINHIVSIISLSDTVINSSKYLLTIS